MQYTTEDIKQALGSKFRPTHTYVLARAADILPKEREGYKVAGTLPDLTQNQEGTMTIMSRPPPEEKS
jgi:hypothetical protein